MKKIRDLRQENALIRGRTIHGSDYRATVTTNKPITPMD